MKYEVKSNPSRPFTRTLTVVVDDMDLMTAKVPKAIQRWYDDLKERKLSDELFYLSEVAKVIEANQT